MTSSSSLALTPKLLPASSLKVGISPLSSSKKTALIDHSQTLETQLKQVKKLASGHTVVWLAPSKGESLQVCQLNLAERLLVWIASLFHRQIEARRYLIGYDVALETMLLINKRVIQLAKPGNHKELVGDYWDCWKVFKKTFGVKETDCFNLFDPPETDAVKQCQTGAQLEQLLTLYSEGYSPRQLAIDCSNNGLLPQAYWVIATHKLALDDLAPAIPKSGRRWLELQLADKISPNDALQASFYSVNVKASDLNNLESMLPSKAEQVIAQRKANEVQNAQRQAVLPAISAAIQPVENPVSDSSNASLKSQPATSIDPPMGSPVVVNPPVLHSVASPATPPVAQPHANFRVTRVSFGGHEVDVGGMAHPVRYSSTGSCHKSFEAFSQMGYKALISLDNQAESASIKPTWETHGGNRQHVVEVLDFTAPTLSHYDQIFAVVNEAAQRGEKVLIHCGEGWGRTGTALASLQLRDAFDKMQRSEAAARAYLRRPVVLDTPVKLGQHSTVPQVMSSSLVADSISKVRQSDTHGSHNRSTHGASVENAVQVASLLELENSLRAALIAQYPSSIIT